MDVDSLSLGQNSQAPESSNCRRRKIEIGPVSQAESDADPSSFSKNDDVCPKKKREETAQKEAAASDLVGDVVMGEARAGSAGARCRSHGAISVVGRRREMEDAVAVELGFLRRGELKGGYDFFGVYDGQGHARWRAAQACGELLPRLVAETVEEEGDGGGDIDWRKAMAAGFEKMDAAVNMGGGSAAVGSSAVVVGENEVVVANRGGSRAVILGGGGGGQVWDNQKPDELERSEVSGRRVFNWNGQRGTSRSMEPQVRVIKRTHEDEYCLILATDGLWDVVPIDAACSVARWCFDSKGIDDAAQDAASLLAEMAMGRGSRDNITIVVVEL